MKYLHLTFLLGLLAFSLMGCGGGGASSKYTLTYSTDWGTGTVVPAKSQRVLIADSGGSVVASSVVNSTRATSQLPFPDLAGGYYRVTSELYSGDNATGTLLGTVNEVVNLDASKAIASSVEASATGILVSPIDATIAVGDSQKFAASFTAANGKLVFGDASLFAWSSTASKVSITPAGIATGVATGTGTLTARANGLTGTASVTISPKSAARKKWTVLLFLNASNNLYPYSDKNMNQIESVAKNPDVQVVVQWKQNQANYPSSSFDGTRRYLVTYDTNSNKINSKLLQDLGKGIDMGKPETLNTFISWAQDKYPADRTGLILWNHGNGWSRTRQAEPITRGISYDDEFNSAIDTWKLAQAIGDHHFDYIAYDACLMQMLEVAYEIKEKADYIVGSEELTPAPGFRYDLALKAVMDNADISTVDATKGWVDCMLQETSYNTSKITQSVIDTSKLQAVVVATSNLADVLRANPSSRASLVQSVRTNAQRFDAGTSHQYFDLYDVARLLKAGDSSLSTAANAVQNAVTDAVVYERHNANSPLSRGIGIDFSAGSAINKAAYANLRLATVTSWDEWLAVAP